ncbi:MAG: hypothetical protein SNG10_04690 [Rikenellaceae bacterium]
MKNLIFSLTALIFMSCGSTSSDLITISTIDELAQYAALSGNNVKMTPGVYQMRDYIQGDVLEQKKEMGDCTYITFSGDNNTFDLSDVTFEVHTEIKALITTPTDVREVKVTGDNNHIKGYKIEHIGNTAGGISMTVEGEGNTIENVTFKLQGSFPYGYGDLFGKGRDRVIRTLQKHCGFLITGSKTTVIGCELYIKALGHGYFIQNSASDITFIDCYVEGELRTTDDILTETNTPASEVDFRTVSLNRKGENVVTPGYMKVLCEDGFRTYSSDNNNIRFINCTAKNTRGGFELRTKGGVYLENCTTIGCERAYWVSDNAVVRGCKGDANYGPLLFVEGHNADVELSLVPTESDRLVHAIATIHGENNSVTINPYNGENRKSPLPILVGYREPLHGEMMTPFTQAQSTSLKLVNNTTMPVFVEEKSVDSNITSVGEVQTVSGVEEW